MFIIIKCINKNRQIRDAILKPVRVVEQLQGVPLNTNIFYKLCKKT